MGVIGYEAFRFLHVVGAIVWLGSGIGLLMLNQQFIRARDHRGLLAVGRRTEALGTKLFAPASLVTVGAGVVMVATTDTLGFGDLWILIGFVGVVLSGVAQMAVAAPAYTRFQALVEEHGPESEDVHDAARALRLGNLLDIGVLLGVVWAMTAKPML
ncbi:DUF2269 family protein [Nitriliruptor alkaliphilus]|uniref:DUF2269 family protein n=1 Tax=Nitriliruptor alkaliphilus TaxID=427918 RepID=UPI0006967730|nr:DUF2269 family protein [Nitriliruptor alkaliphilus]